MIWQIWPDSYEKGNVENMPIVTYGKVPAGWTQKIPSQGEPPVLIEGVIYQAGGPAIDSHLAYMRFTIRDGKLETLPLDDDEANPEH